MRCVYLWLDLVRKANSLFRFSWKYRKDVMRKLGKSRTSQAAPLTRLIQICEQETDTSCQLCGTPYTTCHICMNVSMNVESAQPIRRLQATSAVLTTPTLQGG